MPVVDVDSHFEIAVPAEEHPLYALRESLPSSEQVLAKGVAGSLYHETPAPDAPTDAALITFVPPGNKSSARYAAIEASAEPGFVSMTVDQRLAWMDEVGIDFSFVNPGAIGLMASLMDDHNAEAMRLSNTFLADYLAGHTDRLTPVSLIDWHDLDGAIKELTRMREAGSRAFWIRAEPFGGVSPAHPDWDRVWSAATDLGMVAILHIGNTPGNFAGGWANVGWNQPGGTGVGGYFRFALATRHHGVELMLNSMIHGGVFGRHPNLTVITEELGVNWLPHFVEKVERMGRPAGPWPFDLKPGEMIRRNVRAALLPGVGDPNPLTCPLLDFSDLLVFCSDYPHAEGNVNPIELIEPSLAQLTTQGRDAFLGGSVAECFTRMGDPLPL